MFTTTVSNTYVYLLSYEIRLSHVFNAVSSSSRCRNRRAVKSNKCACVPRPLHSSSISSRRFCDTSSLVRSCRRITAPQNAKTSVTRPCRTDKQRVPTRGGRHRQDTHTQAAHASKQAHTLLPARFPPHGTTTTDLHQAVAEHLQVQVGALAHRQLPVERDVYQQQVPRQHLDRFVKYEDLRKKAATPRAQAARQLRPVWTLAAWPFTLLTSTSPTPSPRVQHTKAHLDASSGMTQALT